LTSPHQSWFNEIIHPKISIETEKTLIHLGGFKARFWKKEVFTTLDVLKKFNRLSITNGVYHRTRTLIELL